MSLARGSCRVALLKSSLARWRYRGSRNASTARDWQLKRKHGRSQVDLRKGVFLAHVGLTRWALDMEFPEDMVVKARVKAFAKKYEREEGNASKGGV